MSTAATNSGTSGTAGVKPGPDDPRRSPGRRRAWAMLAALLAVGGMTGAVFAAGGVARDDAEKSRQSFELSAREVASTLELAIKHLDDLDVNAGAFYVQHPQATTTDFEEWTTVTQSATRYPEVQGIGYVELVTAAGLAAFTARVEADPKIVLGSDRTYTVSPPGARAELCLTPVMTASNPATMFPPGTDVCSSPMSPILMAARDSGVGAYLPFQAGSQTLLAVQIPIYRDGVVPPTITARRATFVAWVGIAVDPKVILDRALQGHPHTEVTLSHVGGVIPTVFSSGAPAAHAQSMTIDLNNGWTVETSQSAASAAVLDNGSSLALLVAGSVLSLLLGVLVFVLGTGRARALRLVAERTAELRGAQAQLVDSARRAGMAEIATNVLHNVGNGLNSVNVSADLVSQKVRASKAANLDKAVALLDAHADDLGDFLTTDARGKALPNYLGKLAATLATERESIDEELRRLTQGVSYIKEIVNAQQSLAGVSGVIEQVTLDDLIDDALRMASTLDDHDLTLTRDVPTGPPLSVDRHRITVILLNLLSNATTAMADDPASARHLRLRAEVIGQAAVFTVTDNGSGITADNLARIFVHGFTTHTGGHGFGLHSSALAAQEMGGTLTAHSDGPRTGATFTLEVPLERVPATV